MAYRDISEAEYREWSAVYDQAAATINGRGDALDKAAELIERDMFLLGATAIEDKLQEGVPDTIHTLQMAGIKVWVLTGDRQETAINIGLSCRLISESMNLVIVNEETSMATKEFIQKRLTAITSQRKSGELEDLALVIDGKSLTFALEKDISKSFLELAIMCKAVVCCAYSHTISTSFGGFFFSFGLHPSAFLGRVSPLQKALVVKLVKKNQKSILLAIGDGANDVSMIQAAHVGVGISGVEGLQAARSSDVAISQFRYLKKLLLVHGAWSYRRLSKLILCAYCFKIIFSQYYETDNLCVDRFILQEYHFVHDAILGKILFFFFQLIKKLPTHSPSSSHSSTTSPAKPRSNHGPSPSTTSSSPSCPHSSSAFSTNLSPHVFSIGTLNCTFSVRKISSSLGQRSGSGW